MSRSSIRSTPLAWSTRPVWLQGVYEILLHQPANVLERDQEVGILLLASTRFDLAHGASIQSIVR